MPLVGDGQDGGARLWCRQRVGLALLPCGKGPEAGAPLCAVLIQGVDGEYGRASAPRCQPDHAGVFNELLEVGSIFLLVFFLECGVSHRFYGITGTVTPVAPCVSTYGV